RVLFPGLVLYSFRFLCACNRARPYLPSFPTRRSSDLVGDRAGGRFLPGGHPAPPRRRHPSRSRRRGRASVDGDRPGVRRPTGAGAATVELAAQISPAASAAWRYQAANDVIVSWALRPLMTTARDSGDCALSWGGAHLR